ncbi:MAG: TCP-1/cpn60 chaperonin family protein, partial [Xanthobacteraceae bacterium]
LLRAARALERLAAANDDQERGIEIVRKAISWPARQIAINAGEDGSIVVGKILEKDSYAFGYDAQTGEYGNLVSKGIIDPTKVVRVALQGAASIAGLLITTEAMVAELPKKQSPGMPGGPGGGMGGMGGMDF